MWNRKTLYSKGSINLLILIDLELLIFIFVTYACIIRLPSPWPSLPSQKVFPLSSPLALPWVLTVWPRRTPSFAPSHLSRLWVVPQLFALTKPVLWPLTKCLVSKCSLSRMSRFICVSWTNISIISLRATLPSSTSSKSLAPPMNHAVTLPSTAVRSTAPLLLPWPSCQWSVLCVTIPLLTTMLTR